MSMFRFYNTVQDIYGNSKRGAVVYIYTAGTGVVATLYENDETTTKGNPITTDNTGLVDFKIPAGNYDFRYVNGDIDRTISDIFLGANDNALNSEEWATNPEDNLISTGAGGDGSTDYSSLHWAKKSEASKLLSDANVVLTNADVVLTNADVVSSAASAAAAAASAAEGLYNTVVAKTFADSPIVPLAAEEGYLYSIDTSGGNVVINLSALSVYAEDMKFAFVKNTVDANTLTINRGGTDTISGNTSATISTQYEVNVITGDSATGTWIKSVQSAALADSSVTLAKMAGITAGNIIAGDASNNPAYVATGTAGQVMTSNGTGSAPTMQDAVGAWNLISSATASASASVEFTSGIDSTYAQYMIVFSDIDLSVAAALTMQASIDGGSTYLNTAGDYYRAHTGIVSSSATVTGAVSETDTVINLYAGNSMDITGQLNGHLILHNPASATDYKSFIGEVAFEANSTTSLEQSRLGGLVRTASAVDAVKFAPTSGNIASGTFYLYGLSKT